MRVAQNVVSPARHTAVPSAVSVSNRDVYPYSGALQLTRPDTHPGAC